MKSDIARSDPIMQEFAQRLQNYLGLPQTPVKPQKKKTGDGSLFANITV
jgi:hypothetical protein